MDLQRKENSCGDASEPMVVGPSSRVGIAAAAAAQKHANAPISSRVENGCRGSRRPESSRDAVDLSSREVRKCSERLAAAGICDRLQSLYGG